ncbi:mitochondrial inner membrane protein required for protein import [Cryptotrichosporon argae]
MLSALRAPMMRRLTVTRPLSTTCPALIRIKSPKESAPSMPPEVPLQPSPAERPAAVPDSIAPPPPFEPVINHPSGAPRPVAETAPADAPHVPQTPPAPEAAAAEAAKEPETQTRTVADESLPLPSLDIDPDANVRIEEPKEQGKERTGAGRKQYVSSIERQRQFWIRTLLASAGVGALGWAFYTTSNGQVSLFSLAAV